MLEAYKTMDYAELYNEYVRKIDFEIKKIVNKADPTVKIKEEEKNVLADDIDAVDDTDTAEHSNLLTKIVVDDNSDNELALKSIFYITYVHYKGLSECYKNKPNDQMPGLINQTHTYFKNQLHYLCNNKRLTLPSVTCQRIEDYIRSVEIDIECRKYEVEKLLKLLSSDTLETYNNLYAEFDKKDSAAQNGTTE